MNKSEVLAMFRSEVLPHIPRGDTVAKREEWNNYTDSLCKEGIITMKQYESWDNPF